MTRFTFLLVVGLLCCVQSVFGQDFPCLYIKQNAGENNPVPGTCPANPNVPATISTRTVEFEHPDKRVGVEDAKGWLKTFWIYGDGNFYHMKDTTREVEEETLDRDYKYHRNGSYNVFPLMIEKKSNKVPPGGKDRSIIIDDPNFNNRPPAEVSDKNISNIAVAAAPLPDGTPFVQRVQSPARADILCSSAVRLGEAKTGFAISTRFIPEGGVALFFYNSVRVLNGGAFLPVNLFPTASNFTPDYVSESNLRVGNTSAISISALQSATRRTYQTVMYQSMDLNPDIPVPASFDEFRFFPILESAVANETGIFTGNPTFDGSGMGDAQFFTLILGNAVVAVDSNGNVNVASANFNPPASLTESERAYILDLIQTHLGQDFLSNVNTTTLEIGNTGLYIRGAAYHQEDVVAVIDPTELRVNSICPVKEKANTYLVDMTLEVCNEGNATEDTVIVNVLKYPGMEINNLQFTTIPSMFPNTLSNPGDTIWSFIYADDLHGRFQEIDNKRVCFTTGFKVETDWTGVQLLRDGKGLTAKVTFTSAIVKPTQDFPNLPFATQNVSEKYGYNCGGPTPTPVPTGNCCIEIALILLAVFLLAIWYGRLVQAERNNS